MVWKPEPPPLTSVDSLSPQGEVLVAHDPNAGEVTEVRNLVIQTSISQLQSNGFYDRYTACIDRAILEDFLAHVAPGWLPLELVMAHYRACEDMQLTNDELSAMGRSVGERIQGATLVSSAKKTRSDDYDPWQVEAQLHRMWQRLYKGGSIQVTKLGPKEKIVEQRGFPMNQFRYYRQGLVLALTAAHEAVGVEISRVRLDRFDPVTNEVTFRLSWL